MRIAVITPVAGRHSHLLLQQDGLAAGTRVPDHYVLVTMDDPRAAPLVASRTPAAETVPVPVQDGCLPLAAARNAGARHALEAGADLLVFLDVDCVPGKNTIARYAGNAVDGALLCGTVAYLPPPPPEGYRLAALPRLAKPHEGRPDPAEGQILRGGDHRLFWSLSFALTAVTWHRTGGFCEEYMGYGGEDTDFARQAADLGVELRWLGGAPVHHQYHHVSRPPVEHLDDILRNGAVFKRRWGKWPMEGWLRDFAEMGLVQYDSRTDMWHKGPPIDS
ncbi:galactosyltransferase-related protein [Streptomyces sp. AM 4-1-1]|uniref:glycosyltransferase family 2 protein n=1 Tax=Streptomyces sp. AM 4-1-1 TaxID=3028710 RepID=UPI0023B91AED|nr:glycosyltransferase family 2 protein [Streptomyces sp. AM 4-1-1]WEH35102.1 galactosyltransferase-related protein [Streptomyces sp. AM 4-1-1]